MTNAQTSFKDDLRAAYNADAKRRDEGEKTRQSWKVKQRDYFIKLLRENKKTSIMELGSGAGLDAVHFKQKGFEILATDLSPEMVKVCQKRGLEAAEIDLYNISSVGRKFDSIYSMNVLLHVPKKDIRSVLEGIYIALKDQGIFYYGVYGGISKEEITIDKSKMGLPRFFSFLSDAELLELVKDKFEILDFETIDVESEILDFHFQSLFLRKK
jgi:cyclopropane fatty-acyl-phospholipid synthase-like methyltransferase